MPRKRKTTPVQLRGWYVDYNKLRAWDEKLTREVGEDLLLGGAFSGFPIRISLSKSLSFVVTSLLVILVSSHAVGTNRITRLYLVFARGTLFIASFTRQPRVGTAFCLCSFPLSRSLSLSLSYDTAIFLLLCFCLLYSVVSIHRAFSSSSPGEVFAAGALALKGNG